MNPDILTAIGPETFTTVLTIIIFILSLLICGTLNLMVKKKFRSMADNLQAKHIHTGFFMAGEIEGDFKGKKFNIGSHSNRLPGSAKGQNAVTVSMTCQYDTSRFIIRKEFFNDIQKWNHAHRLGCKEEKVFFWKMTVPSLFSLNDNEKSFLEQAFRSLYMSPNEIASLFASLGILSIGKNLVSLEVGGWDKNKFKNALTLLKAISDNIEQAANAS